MMNKQDRDNDYTLSLATCSVASFRPDMGVPVRTTVGPLRFFKYGPAENISELAPKGIFKSLQFENAPIEVMKEAYLQHLDFNGSLILDQLNTLNIKHKGQRLVLLCFEDVRKGDVCHRTWAAEWFMQRFRLEVPEISPNCDSHTAESESLFSPSAGQTLDHRKGKHSDSNDGRKVSSPPPDRPDGEDDQLVVDLVSCIEKIAAETLTNLSKIDGPTRRARIAQCLLPAALMLKDSVFALRSDSVLQAWESGDATYRDIASQLGVSKALVQIMVREARERRSSSDTVATT